jgi:hypothetical protein
MHFIHLLAQEVQHVGDCTDTQIPRRSGSSNEDPQDPPRLEAQMGPLRQPDSSKSSIAYGVDHPIDQKHVESHIREGQADLCCCCSPGARIRLSSMVFSGR